MRDLFVDSLIAVAVVLSSLGVATYRYRRLVNERTHLAEIIHTTRTLRFYKCHFTSRLLHLTRATTRGYENKRSSVCAGCRMRRRGQEKRRYAKGNLNMGKHHLFGPVGAVKLNFDHNVFATRRVRLVTASTTKTARLERIIAWFLDAIQKP